MAVTGFKFVPQSTLHLRPTPFRYLRKVPILTSLRTFLSRFFPNSIIHFIQGCTEIYRCGQCVTNFHRQKWWRWPWCLNSWRRQVKALNSAQGFLFFINFELGFLCCVIIELFMLFNWWRKKEIPWMEEDRLQRAWNSQFVNWSRYPEGSKWAQEKGYILLFLSLFMCLS